MSDDDKKAIESLVNQRDNLQAQMADARHKRADMLLENREKYRGFTQKVGELSFLIGAALAPVIIVSGSDKISHLGFVLVGLGLYLLVGFLAMWSVKTGLEKDLDDTPFVGLKEEIHTYPIINALNKLFYDIDDEKLKVDYRKSISDFSNWNEELSKGSPKPKVSIWLDVLLTGFVLASLLVARAVWTFGDISFWIVFVSAFLAMFILTAIGYVRSWQNQVNLINDQKELARIKGDYQRWFSENVLGKAEGK